MSKVVEFKLLQRTIDSETILKGLNGEVAAGDVVAILGVNGSGKTTLLDTLMGFGYPSFGMVKLLGNKSTDMNGEFRQKIAYVPQQDELISNLTIQEHFLICGLAYKKWDQVLAEKLTLNWLGPISQTVNKMSVGQRQKLSIILALSQRPELLVLDEPVASLDPVARRLFLQQLVELVAQDSLTILFSTHIVSDAERIANKVWIIKDGNFVYADEMDSLKENVVRVNVPIDSQWQSIIEREQILSVKVSEKTACLTLQLCGGNTLEALSANIGEPLEVSPVSLEDLFLDLNKVHLI